MKFSILVLLLSFSFLNGQEQEKPLIRYEGSSTIAHFIKDAESVYGLARFEIKTETESSGGEQALINGTADMGGVARTPSSQVQGKGVVSTLIGWDAIAVVVNNSNPVSNLTKQQLKNIFTNKITNWKELGGPDLKITPYIVEISSATRKVFRAAIMGQDDYVSCKTVAPDKDILSRVANDAGGIGQISFSFLGSTGEQLKTIQVDGQIASVTNQSYPITRPLYLLWWPGRQVTADFARWTQTQKAQDLITKRFIGKTQETHSKTGKLLVYSETHAIEEGGAYYYPFESYEIYTADGRLLQYVENHLEPTDENPSSINLQPGQYLVWTETAKKKGGEKVLVNIVAGQTSSIVVDKQERLQLMTGKPKQELVSNLRLYADYRFRAEHDWDSRRLDGTYRDDRTRFRYRLRFGFNYKWNEYITFGGRLRSGNSGDPQSPHITLGENLPEYGISIDKAYLKGKLGKWWGWIGKNNFPFWKQNEFWWDDDVTPQGIVLGGNLMTSSSIKLKPTAGYFIINNKGQNFGKNPTLLAGQITIDIDQGNLGLTLANGYYHFSNMPDRSDVSGIHTLTYQLLISSAKIEFDTKLPISIGIDIMTNLARYDQDTLINSAGLQNERIGYVASVKIGSLNEKGKILFAYYYSHVPKYAVVPYLAQDDWVRWGFSSSAGTRSSNFKGHELRLAYAFGKGFNVVARSYFVQAIKKEKPSQLELETGNRFRLDFNLKF